VVEARDRRDELEFGKLAYRDREDDDEPDEHEDEYDHPVAFLFVGRSLRSTRR
jgi:hypothetical protein